MFVLKASFEFDVSSAHFHFFKGLHLIIERKAWLFLGLIFAQPSHPKGSTIVTLMQIWHDMTSISKSWPVFRFRPAVSTFVGLQDTLEKGRSLLLALGQSVQNPSSPGANVILARNVDLHLQSLRTEVQCGAQFGFGIDTVWILLDIWWYVCSAYWCLKRPHSKLLWKKIEEEFPFEWIESCVWSGTCMYIHHSMSILLNVGQRNHQQHQYSHFTLVSFA